MNIRPKILVAMTILCSLVMSSTPATAQVPTGEQGPLSWMEDLGRRVYTDGAGCEQGICYMPWNHKQDIPGRENPAKPGDYLHCFWTPEGAHYKTETGVPAKLPHGYYSTLSPFNGSKLAETNECPTLQVDMETTVDVTHLGEHDGFEYAIVSMNSRMEESRWNTYKGDVGYDWAGMAINLTGDTVFYDWAPYRDKAICNSSELPAGTESLISKAKLDPVVATAARAAFEIATTKCDNTRVNVKPKPHPDERAIDTGSLEVVYENHDKWAPDSPRTDRNELKLAATLRWPTGEKPDVTISRGIRADGDNIEAVEELYKTAYLSRSGYGGDCEPPLESGSGCADYINPLPPEGF